MAAILRGSLLSLVKGSGELRWCFAAMRRAQPIVINRASTRPAKPRADARERVSLAPRLTVLGDTALHGAMKSGPEIGNLSLAVEGRQRRLQQLGAETRLGDLVDARTLGFIPGHGQAIVADGP